MTKKTGINIRLDAFIEIDKTNFAQQRDAFGVLAEIEQTGKLPANFFDLAVIVDLSAKQGSADVPDAPIGTDPDEPALPGVIEEEPVTEMIGDKITKRGGKPVEE